MVGEIMEIIFAFLIVVASVALFDATFHGTCPKCQKRTLNIEYLDSNLDKMVYKCDNCGKRFI